MLADECPTGRPHLLTWLSNQRAGQASPAADIDLGLGDDVDPVFVFEHRSLAMPGS